MIVLYNSDLRRDAGRPAVHGRPARHPRDAPRSGYEIVDKANRQGIFLGGDMATGFRASVEALAQEATDTDAIDAHLARYTALSAPGIVLH
jgi:hypothetical protein